MSHIVLVLLVVVGFGIAAVVAAVVIVELIA